MASSTAQPLPPLQQADQLGPLDIMLAVAAGATNGTHPDAVVGAAQTASTPEEAATNAQAIAGYGTATAAAKYMRNQNGTNQTQIWGQLSKRDQEALKQSGYNPPGEGLLGQVTGAIGSAVSTTANALGAPLRGLQHGVRTAFDVSSNYSLTNPDDWAKAWDETKNGQSYIDPGFKKQALAQYGDQTYNLALKLAQGATPQSIVQSVPAAEQQQVAKLLQGKEVQDATAYLNAGHLSEGRVAADIILGQQGYKTKGLTEHSTAYELISGSIDAAIDWFGDPLVWGGHLAGALTAGRWSRYAVKDGGDVLKLYDRSSSVRRGMETLANHVRSIIESGEGGYKALESLSTMGRGVRNAAAESNLIPKLVEAQADSAEKVRKWFEDTENLGAFIRGSGMRSEDIAQLPHLSYWGAARLAVKGGLTKTLNFADNSSIDLHIDPADTAPGPLQFEQGGRFRVGASRLVTHAFRLMPTARTFNPNGPAAMENLRDVASMFLPPRYVDAVISSFARNPDLGAKWRVYRSLMSSLGQVAGLDPGSEIWDEVMGKYISEEGRYYGKEDEVFVNGQRMHAGLLKQHQNNAWLIPSFRELATGARKTLVQKSVTAMNGNMLDKFMGIWRPLTLARLGFSLRVGGEEAFGMLLRSGPMAYLRSIAANLEGQYIERRATVSAAEAEKTALNEARIANGLKEITAQSHGVLYNMLRRGLTDEEADSATSIADLWKKSFTRSVHSVMEKAGHALTYGEYKAAVDQLVDHGWLEHGSPFNEHLTALHYDSNAGPGSITNLEKLKDKGSGKFITAELTGNGRWKGYMSGEDLYKIMYQRSLHQLATDDWGREALLTKRSVQDRVQTLADRLMEDPAWKESVRSTQTSGGDLVKTGQTTERAAAEDHASKIVHYAERLLRSPKSNEYLKLDTAAGNEQLSSYLLREAKAPPWYASKEMTEAGHPEALGNLEVEDLPNEVAGPELVQTVGSGMDPRRLTNYMFSHYIGPQINWLSRQPMFIHNYAESLKAYGPWAQWAERQGMSAERIEEMMHTNSTQRAINMSLPYVHNPELRSQMSQITRNIAPFWFAQEQFYKRWGRTFVYSPWAYRRAQLTSHAVGSVGFIHKDPETGQEYFVYPGSAIATDLLTHVLGTFGLHVSMPVQADLIGEISMLNPGVERGFLPNFGPVIVAPMDGLKALDPKMAQAIDGIQGGGASSSSYLSAILPVDAVRLLDAVAPSAVDPAAFASAQMSAIQYLDVTGHGLGMPGVAQVGNGPPPTGASGYKPGDYFTNNNIAFVLQPDGHWVDFTRESQDYLTRVRNWTRIFFVTRALYGFSGPASPQDYFDPKGLSAQLQTLMNEMPYQEAVSTFMAMHPNATAMTLGQTSNIVNGFLPATQSAMAFLSANPQLISQYPSASMYFVPMADTGGKFDLGAYQEQLSEGLRQQRTPQQFLDEIAYQEAANDYFAVDTYKNQLYARKEMTNQQVSELWTQFSEQFMAANPLFAQMYTDQGAVTRAEIMAQVSGVLQSGDAPEGQQTQDVRELYNAYVQWQTATGNFGQPNAPTTTMNTQANISFAQWVAQFVKAHPDVQPLVQRVIAPDLSTTLTNLAAQGATITL